MTKSWTGENEEKIYPLIVIAVTLYEEGLKLKAPHYCGVDLTKTQ